MNKVIVLPSQSLMDIAIQHCGGIAAWPVIVELNGLSGLTAEIVAGQELIVPDPVQQRVAGIYARQGHKPATTPIDHLEGIDYWFVYEYVVQ